MKTLITGGSGYTGIPLCAALLEAGHEVTIVENFLYGYDSVLHLVAHPRLHIVKADIRNPDRSYLKGMDVVFHLAAISGYPACEANPHSARLINLDASIGLARALDPGQLLVFASTTSFYGSSGELSNEESEIKAVSLYGVTKRDAEAAIMERENSISLRWATVFGTSARMRAGLLVNDFVQAAVQDRVIVLYDADSRRTFMHVDDLVRGYLFAVDHVEEMRGKVFNMGSGKLNYTKREIAEQIRKSCPCDVLEAEIGDTDARNFLVSFERAKALGFDCEKSLADGIDELAKLYRFYAPNSFFKTI